MPFEFVSRFKTAESQARAVEGLNKNIKKGAKDQVLLGVTGSGKTFVASRIIESMQRPTLIISHNKTLAAQLYQEFKEFFPQNAVHYFVSYYDYYQPEAYIPQSDTYIEKDAKVNEELDKLRHAAVQDLMTRPDVIIVASVSCIYNIGSPQFYQKVSLEVRKGQKIKLRDFLDKLCSLQYKRNDVGFEPGVFRVRGGIVDVFKVTGEEIIRVEFLGDVIKEISTKKPGFNDPGFKSCPAGTRLYPAQFWVSPKDSLNISIENIRLELEERLRVFRKENKLLEAQRLEERTNYDLEMIGEVGWCHGIENYSRHFEFREPGEAPFSLLDYFPKDFLTFIDESHMTIPQIRGMYYGDRSRKESLIKYGFRLPSAIDNRPLKFEEFKERINQSIYLSATPADYEKQRAERSGKEIKGNCIVELLVRPTGLLEPSIETRPTKNQVKDLIEEIKKRKKRHQRVLVVTLTKRLAEDLADYLVEAGIKTRYLHSEIKTLERPGILRDLRMGKYDVIVGINLLREGLDLPEVALVAILDADKEGFLRTETTLIQTMGRAARHPMGHAILYADKITKSMKAAIGEIKRRRRTQEEYNKKHNIAPKPIVKEIREWAFLSQEKDDLVEFGDVKDIRILEKEMKKAAKALDFEKAAGIKEMIEDLRQNL